MKPKTLTKRQRQAQERVWSFLIIAAIVIFVLVKLFNLAKPYFLLIGIVIGLLLALALFWWVRKILKRRRLTGELESYLQRALEAMDDTSRTYTNEEEANKELVAVLKSQGLNAVYQFRLSEKRTADAKVGDVLIEGKLAPAVSDVDRLIGQLQEYSKYRFKVNVVIYGRLDKESLERISNEIGDRYRGKVFLTYLANPKRRRA